MKTYLLTLIDRAIEQHCEFCVHPLGFIVIKLQNNTQRLHLWDKNLPSEQSEFIIHDHIFNFKSTVLAGKIKNINFQENILGSTFYQYRTQYISDTSVIVYSKTTTNLVPTETFSISAGDTYAISNNTIHMSVAETEIAATLLTCNNFDRTKSPRVFSKNLILSPQSFTRRKLNLIEIEALRNKFYNE